MEFDVNTLRIAATLVSFATFIGIAAWAYARRNGGRFEEAAHIPFSDED
jgi:cytochrome c oxidase cbb3-type subunit 4